MEQAIPGTAAEAGTGPAPEGGRALVRTLFVQRLDEAGIRPGRGRLVRDHREMLDRLVGHLAYMAPDNLRTLATETIRAAGGPLHDLCPSEATIRGFAEGLQRKPVAMRRIVTSWLASVEGPHARAGGWLTDLYRWLLRHGRPPTAYDLRQIRDTAEGNRRLAGVMTDRLERGALSQPDRVWLSRWIDDSRAAERLVAAGEEVRAGDGAGDGAGTWAEAAGPAGSWAEDGQ